jgi:hypothetical protein
VRLDHWVSRTTNLYRLQVRLLRRIGDDASTEQATSIGDFIVRGMVAGARHGTDEYHSLPSIEPARIWVEVGVTGATASTAKAAQCRKPTAIAPSEWTNPVRLRTQSPRLSGRAREL